jgi:Na+/H+ antiporter NhaD/arsenite permease-like protein
MLQMANGSFFVVVLFLLTYAGVAIGRVPGLMIDRTGIALLGAIAMVVSGAVSLGKAVEAVDLPTILLLYALMVLSAQLRLGGFYTWVGFRITCLLGYPRIFLAVLMATSAVLSAILANDIICLAFTPVLTISLLNANLSPLPFLLGLAISSNIGSAATIIGNPQNMLIGQVGNLHFGQFLAWCGPPSVLALSVSYMFICWFYRKGFAQTHPFSAYERDPRWPRFNRWQSIKGLAAAIILVVLFFTSIPRELSAIAVAGVLLCSRHMKSRQMLELIDWHLVTLFCALFVVIQGIAVANVPSMIVETLSAKGIVLRNLSILTAVSAVMSNMVSNVPATMLLTRFLDPANPLEWYTLAISSTFAGNLVIIGSIANLIVIEQAKNFGVEISFKEHARIGIPVTLASLLILIGWIYLQ